MLSTFTKKIIGLQKSIKPFNYCDRSGTSWLIIYKGYNPHYQWFQQNQSLFKDTTKIYCFDRCSIDVALEMAARNTCKLSYISTRNYQTVTAVPRTQKNINTKKNEPFESNPNNFSNKASANDQKRLKIDKYLQQRAKDILNNYDFVIKNSFLDIHPLEAYQKMCGYLLLRSNPNILKYFQGFKCSNQTLFQSFHVLPILNELRNKLFIDDELKVSFLERRPQVTISNQMTASYIERWKKEVQLQKFEDASSSFDEQQKIAWVFANNFGEQITKKEILSQKYQRFSYAIFI